MSEEARAQVRTATHQQEMTPAAVVDWLKEGNRRFVAGTPTARDLLGQAAATAGGQFPLAAVLSCIDSRVPPEIVLDLGIGDAFVARTAGNVADGDVLGSLEFATAVAGASVILVLGHEQCGAVMGACDGVELGHLTGLLAKITPAVEAVSGTPAPGSDDPDLVSRIVERNTRDVAAFLAEESDVLSEHVASGDLLILTAVYDVESGVIRWLV